MRFAISSGMSLRKGFINGITIDAGENSAQQFKLLMTADNNLESLVY